jgi:hypothetical protein
MGNKSSFQKREKRILEKFKTLEKIHPNQKHWENVRDMSKASQPRTWADWPGMKEKSASTGPRMHGIAPVLTRGIFYAGSKPLRNTRAVLPEVNRLPQPWQKKTARRELASHA